MIFGDEHVHMRELSASLFGPLFIFEAFASER